MKYIVPLFDCSLCGNDTFPLCKNVKYSCEFVDNKIFLVVGKNGENPFVLNFKEFSSQNLSMVRYGNEEYWFLKPNKNFQGGFFQIKHNNKQILIAIFKNINISVDGETVVNIEVSDIEYSHFESFNSFCIIHFKGKRNFFVVLKDKELKSASYYDEVNITDKEQIYMCKLNDSLNHGRVFKIDENGFEEYLVYLDDFDLNLKKEFVACVFLDCVLANNVTYANNLLIKNLQQSNAEKISEFFPCFDAFYPINKNEIILMKKNTLSGIYYFEMDGNFISNITQQV